MKLITGYPVLVQKQGRDIAKYSNLDGGSSIAQIKNFQNWSNKIKGTKLAVDGKWGPQTAAAYKQNGAAYEAAASATANTLAGLFGPDASGGNSASSPGTNTTAPKPKRDFFGKLTNFWGKAKDSGAVDSAKNVLGQTKVGQKYMGGTNGQTPTDTTSTDYSQGTVIDSASGEKKGLSTNAKIGIAVGFAAVVIAIVVLKKKK